MGQVEVKPQPAGNKTVGFFVGLNEAIEKMTAPIQKIGAVIKMLIAEAYLRGFNAGFDAGKAAR